MNLAESQLAYVAEQTFDAGASSSQLICHPLASSPLSDDCRHAAMYLRETHSDEAVCSRPLHDVATCTPLQIAGSCLATLCGPAGSSMLCSAAADYIDILTVACKNDLISSSGSVSEGRLASLDSKPIIALEYSNATRPNPLSN